MSQLKVKEVVCETLRLNYGTAFPGTQYSLCVRPSALKEYGAFMALLKLRIPWTHKYAQASTLRARRDISRTESVRRKYSRLAFTRFYIVYLLLGETVHFVRRSLTGLLYQPRMMLVNMEQSVE
jgi:hypothetical protein